jgi:uncharacterized membrane protein (UPF0127 family)
MNFKQTIFLFFLLVPFVVTAQQEKLDTCELTILDKYRAQIKVTVELAETAKERTYGLMHRKSLGENEGMLFVYKSDQYMNFWMKNVSIPLSIAFINKAGVIIDIQDMETDNGAKTYPSPEPVRYALEMNKGFFKKNKIYVGDRLLLNGCFSQQDTILP